MKIVSLLVVTALMSGCASMVSQSSWPVAVTSNPGGAIFTVTNKKGEKVHTGTTPSTVHLLSGAGYFDGETYTLHFKKAGYTKADIQEKTATLKTRLNNWYWGNLMLGPLAPIGFLIADPATGAMFSLSKSLNVDLTAQGSSAVEPASSGHEAINPNNTAPLKNQK